MQHAEIRDLLADAALSPGGPDALPAPVETHLAWCQPCREDHAALRMTMSLLALVAPEHEVAVVAADALPGPGARARMLEALRATGDVRPAPVPVEGAVAPLYASPRPTLVARSRRLLAPLLAAAAVIVVAASLVTLRSALIDRDAATEDTRALATVTVERDRVLRQPDHRDAVLIAVTGAAGGTVLLTPAGNELVVVSDALAEPASSERMECFLERDGQRVPIGYMRFARGVAFWAGPIRNISDPGRPGDRFVVALGEGMPPVLSASF